MRAPRRNTCGYNRVSHPMVLRLSTGYHWQLFLNTFSRFLSRVSILNRMFHWLSERTKRRGRLITRYERIGLVLFVAIPLPVTGAWTGSLAAVLFGLRFKQAFLSIFIGILIAGIIVTCATLFGWAILGLLSR